VNINRNPPDIPKDRWIVETDWKVCPDPKLAISVCPDPQPYELTALKNSKDWLELKFHGDGVIGPGEPPPPPPAETVEELTKEEDERIFTEYAVAIDGPGSVYVVPPASLIFSYAVTNTGEGDDVYEVIHTTTLDPEWVDTRGVPETLTLAAGESETFHVPVEIPAGTPEGEAGEIVITVISGANPLILDVAETRIDVVAPEGANEDGDGDGLPDRLDANPGSEFSPTMVIGGMDSGVANKTFSEGLTMSDQIAACAEAATNHGQFISRVAQLTNQWKRAGLIGGTDKDHIMKAAASSNIGKE
jgi:hypothetical protein